MGDSGGERTYAGHGPRPARPGRKQEAGFSIFATVKKGGVFRQAQFEFVRGQGQST